MYNVVVEETFKGGPIAKTVQLNYCGCMMFTSKDSIVEYIDAEVEKIYAKYTVLGRAIDVNENSLVYKILFERKGRHGRLLRRYIISPYRKQNFDEFELL